MTIQLLISYLAIVALLTNQYIINIQAQSQLDISTLTLVAEFVTVDYLWGNSSSTYSRDIYEETGQFVVSNNIITGVKVSQSGDIFVAVPRWTSGVPSSLNKLVANPNGPGYVLNPWPSWEFNAINKSNSLQYAQSFIIDSKNIMWIPEVGRTNFYDSNSDLTTSGAAGIFWVNITSGEMTRPPYYFPNHVVSHNNSFLNDIVLDEVHGFAYFTNTWGDGGIVVFDSNKNNSWSFQSISTMINGSYDFCVNGKCYGTAAFTSPSDGIAISNDMSTLYWSPVHGQGLYSIATSILQNPLNTDAIFQANVVYMGQKTGCSDGLLFLNGNLLYGNIQISAIGSVNDIQSYTAVNSLTLASSSVSSSSASTLNWIDTFSIDFNNPNAFYFTSNKLNLFFTNALDFTGQSGFNFCIYHAILQPSSPLPSADLLSSGAIAAIIGVCIIAVLSSAAMVYRYFYLKNPSVKFANSRNTAAAVEVDGYPAQRRASSSRYLSETRASSTNSTLAVDLKNPLI